METNINLQHWQSLAQTHGKNLSATTKCESIKTLEIDALVRRIQEIQRAHPGLQLRVLEVGCGNALNGLALCQYLPDILWLGCDYSTEMVHQAIANIMDVNDSVRRRMSVCVGNALNLGIVQLLENSSTEHLLTDELARQFSSGKFNIVYTDRCLVNLASASEQVQASKQIAKVLVDDGYFLMLENSQQSHSRLNELRECLGLPYRPPATYNVFIDEDKVIAAIQDDFNLKGVDDFGSLHDILLYVLKPFIHPQQQITYDDDLMTAVTKLSLQTAEKYGYSFGSFGQNRLWRWQKKNIGRISTTAA